MRLRQRHGAWRRRGPDPLSYAFARYAADGRARRQSALLPPLRHYRRSHISKARAALLGAYSTAGARRAFGRGCRQPAFAAYGHKVSHRRVCCFDDRCGTLHGIFT